MTSDKRVHTLRHPKIDVCDRLRDHLGYFTMIDWRTNEERETSADHCTCVYI
ncbi:unnamed protein product [Periconia digitata]|uniref:Uncharacterized protein n=1 Tax=Periconia digitata TaxID=1303443 RepID=A0A9W4U893_9PLEO|nr:unnamed protein product [Periconia digitata]